jgi:hypothetical protein
MIRTVLVAGLIALPLLTAAPAVADNGSPSSTVSCSPCVQITQDIQEGVTNWLQLPGVIAGNYAGIGDRAREGWGSLPQRMQDGWSSLPQRIKDGWSHPGGTGGAGAGTGTGAGA